MRKIIIVGLIFFCVILFSGSVSASTIMVNPSDYIQDKIDNANSGDTLNLSAGTYTQHDIKVNKSLTITGPQTTGSPTAIIDAQNYGRAFNITDGITVNLKYLTIKNGNATNFDGGGVQNNGNLTVTNCILQNNSAHNGAGIYSSGILTVIKGNIINNNASYGGGIYNENGSVTVSDSNINQNTAQHYGGGIYGDYGTLTVYGCNINNNVVGSSGGGISIWYGSCILTNSNINNNTAADFGGGIINSDCDLTVTGCNITSNAAINEGGGGIYNQNANCTVINSNICNNAADFGGGIDNNPVSYLTITGCNIKNNTAFGEYGFGGGIYANFNVINATGCNFEFNQALKGNAIFNENGATYNRILHFNRFNDPGIGYEIYIYSGNIDARYNWWGSNEDPSSKIYINPGYYGSVDTSCWLVLNVTANSTANSSGISPITADLLHDSSGGYHDPAEGHVTDGLPLTFTTTLGTINNPVTTVNGIAQTSLHIGNICGTTDISTTLDTQNVHNSITILDVTAPTITINPKGGYYNTNKSISLSIDEPGTIYYTINGSTPTTSSLQYTAPIIISSNTILKFFAIDTHNNPSEIYNETYIIDTIKPTATANVKSGLYKTNKVIYLSMNESGAIYYTTNGNIPTTASTKYTGPITISSTTILKFIAVDNAGNPSTLYTEKYTIDKTAPKVTSTYPKHYATGVSRTRNITIKFSEKIKANSYWSKIVVKDKYGHAVKISKSISGNILYIKTGKRSSYSYYTVYIPKAAVKDYAGNNLAAGYTFKFKTGRY